TTLLPQALNGIFTGSIYALFAVGYTLVFGVLDILNLAHSAVFMLGAVITYGLAVTLGLPFLLAALLATLPCATVGYGIDLAASLGWIVRRTSAGRAIRAVAENPKAARLMGMDVDAVIAWTLVLTSALGAVAGILYGLSQHDINPFMGRDQIELKGLAVIVLGGMGSIRGAVVAGYLLGLAEVAALVFLGSNVSGGVAFVLLFIALVALPGGILRGRSVARQV